MDNIKVFYKIFEPGYYAIFRVAGQYYYASLAVNADGHNTEVMIFKWNDNQISFGDALGEYRKRDVDFTPDALRDCIEEFTESLS